MAALWLRQPVLFEEFRQDIRARIRAFDLLEMARVGHGFVVVTVFGSQGTVGEAGGGCARHVRIAADEFDRAAEVGWLGP